MYTIQLAGGISVQGYVEPATPGSNEVHLTFFAPDGGEQPVDLARFEATSADGDPVPLEPTELSPGHFVAEQDLTQGRWTFRFEASTPEDTPLSGYFREEISG